MHLIKVNAINSTNSYGREMFKKNPSMSPTCILAERQLQGRGQRGTHWYSRPGQNLTFSIIFPKPPVSLNQQFLLSAVTSIGLIKGLRELNIPKLKVKWPNDIMAANYKIGGVLIENVVSDGKLSATIIGIGLNVNQTDFERLPKASSLKLISGNSFEPEEVLNAILSPLEEQLNNLATDPKKYILQDYQKLMFRKDIASTFQSPDGRFFAGVINGVSSNGKLMIEVEDEGVKEFDLKEVKLCF